MENRKIRKIGPSEYDQVCLQKGIEPHDLDVKLRARAGYAIYINGKFTTYFFVDESDFSLVEYHVQTNNIKDIFDAYEHLCSRQNVSPTIRLTKGYCTGPHVDELFTRGFYIWSNHSAIADVTTPKEDKKAIVNYGIVLTKEDRNLWSVESLEKLYSS